MSEVQKEKPFDIYDFSDVSPDIQRQNQIICQVDPEKPSDVAIKLRRQKEITNTSSKKKISDTASLTESETDYSDDNITDKDFDVNCTSESDPNSDESIKSKLSESLTSMQVKMIEILIPGHYLTH
nr:unnamed protein product [Callosobruchus analis]